ncbi:MAG: alpha/beta fold hydrolase [Acidimicrobiales bacterium]
MPRVSATPRASGSVTLRDGRLLAYAEWGDPAGRPVAMFHGNPATRLQCPDEDASAAAGVRLITVDRPGFGGSTPLPGRTLLSWADDYAEFHASLGLPPCPVMGWSAGGPYALACAFAQPDIVTSVGVAGSVGPIDEVPEAYGDEMLGRARLLGSDRPAAEAATVEGWASFVADPVSAYDGWFFNSPTPDGPDQRLYARPDVRAAMDEWARDAARQGTAGVVSDSMVFLQPWGFSVADITRDAAVWVGDEAPADRLDSDYFAATIPGVTYVIYPGDGHLLTLPRWAEMLAWLH